MVWIKTAEGWKLEHRAIIEDQLGRKLDTNTHVHHPNEIRSDNRLENLQPMSRSEHSSLHSRDQHAEGNFGQKTWTLESYEAVSAANKIYPDELVEAIRDEALTWTGSYKKLADKFGVSISWCRNVVLGKRRGGFKGV